MFNVSEKDLYSGVVKFDEKNSNVEIFGKKSQFLFIIMNLLKTPEAAEWYKAMVEEIDTMTDREVWDLGPKPSNKKILCNRRVYTLKKNENNDDVKFKAHLVTQGFRQNKG
ncbi:hypothetical protein AVEN_66242-1 [Araneus ventricosus]|uniref:Reverse transcriptase Ty1/copia-type domain-containing protein n=1 Tax=Araneus ventricosus TaxID=182803 RepID=A0A4Y2NT27_ARAVE|nr:hypothetical protein AVEN_66242-1 [Araneus ventricosus]